ncbi:MAG: Holliday junction resolvase RuvX [Solirubrobacterales bacterium]|nr:Holliday junction resolvase RuvX [Solirubrobacterales bacterium]
MSRVVALDHGSARCGVASCDPSGTIVTPLEAIAKPDTPIGLEAIGEVIREREADLVVVGLPLGMDGATTDQTNKVKHFAAQLRKVIAPVEVEVFDERLTTKAAQEIGGSASEDSRAAAVLLERWLAVAEQR